MTTSSDRVAEPVARAGPRLKERPEDFVVEEIPAYAPAGFGEHAYLFIEKRDATTSGVARALARMLGVPEREIGFAGLKDRRAVTRQWFSVRDPAGAVTAQRALGLEAPMFRVLEADRHGNKLRRGHLAGNRFEVTVRGVGVARLPDAVRRLEAIRADGIANGFGSQRYGSRGNNHRIGRALALGREDEALRLLAGLTEPGDGSRYDAEARGLFDAGRIAEALEAFPSGSVAERRALGALARGGTARDAIHAVGALQRSYWFSALQSAVFDDVLADRLERRAPWALAPGDLAFKHDTGAVFRVDAGEDAQTLARRVAALEISPSGPMWGPDMTRAAAETDQAERAALARAGLSPEDLARAATGWRLRSLGARRAMRVPVADACLDAGADDRGEFLRARFTLPAGAFATVVAADLFGLPDEAHRRRAW